MMDIEWLRKAHRQTRKCGAPGVDGQTAAEYAKDLEGNLQSLLNRAKSGTYQAPPVRRAYIPKGNSKTEKRPIGIPTLEDKVLQRAVVMLLEPIYEQDFLECSYGFRPGRSAHQALQALWHSTMKYHGGWILEVDIRSYFDTLDHAHLRGLVKQRVCDGVLMRLIGKWLKAGVLEDGNIVTARTTQVRAHSTFWDSPITGGDLGKGVGSSNARPFQAGSTERSGGLLSGAVDTGTSRSSNNTVH
jgi:group II intron reverse transcriptase/maturase